MKKLLISAATLMVLTQASAADATLATATKVAYEDSLLDMVEPLDQQAARALVFKLLALAAASVEANGLSSNRLETIKLMTEQPQVYLDAVAPYEGMTAADIMALPTD